MKKLLFLASLFLLTSAYKPKEITWIAIGDSITYLNDHQNETGNRITKGYMTRFSRKNYLIFISSIKGHNGWTSGGIADKIETLGLTSADVYSPFFLEQTIGGKGDQLVKYLIIKTILAAKTFVWFLQNYY